MTNKLLKKYTEAQNVFYIIGIITFFIGLFVLFSFASIDGEKQALINKKCNYFLSDVSHTGVINKDECNNLITFLNNNDIPVVIKTHINDDNTENIYKHLDTNIQLQRSNIVMIESEPPSDFHGSTIVSAYHKSDLEK